MHGPGTNEFNFGDDPDHRPDPGVRSPKSEIQIHFFTELSIMLAFGGGLCSLSTWLRPFCLPITSTSETSVYLTLWLLRRLYLTQGELTLF